ncbi:MAG: hypothetical protein HY747_03485 [Elusimicrobia bacterium]|nr:hypothetical protein [Elusimicrobiota bacterium]
MPKSKLPAYVSTAAALVLALLFRPGLPMPEAWEQLRKILFPLAFLDLAFHEAGHWIFGILGWQFLTTAGGTLMQLAMPTACLVHFLRRKSRSGALAVLFWIGFSLVNVAYYAADAKLQALVLITGESGAESGMHDWGYLFGALGLRNYCVGIGQILFALGCFLMAYPPAYGVFTLWGGTSGNGDPN